MFNKVLRLSLFPLLVLVTLRTASSADVTPEEPQKTAIQINTKTGVLHLETFDPKIQLQMEQGGRSVKLIDEASKQSVTFDVNDGSYVNGADKKSQPLDEEFRLNRGGRVIARAWIQPSQPQKGFRDDFNGKQSDKWKFLNKNPNHISLKKKPGTLTITTEQGGFFALRNNIKNLMYIDNPFKEGEDFVLTTRLVNFQPEANFNHAGLICFEDQDNYALCSMEWDDDHDGRSICFIREEAARVLEQAYLEVDRPIDAFWLRMIKNGNKYLVASSLDGEHYHIIGVEKWGNGSPSKIGLVAKNGGRGTKNVDANFDFFEIRPITDGQKKLFSDYWPK